MGVLSVVLAANDTKKKLSTWTQICSAYSWVNVGGKLLKFLALKRLFAEAIEIKRKLHKISGLLSCTAHLSVLSELHTIGAVSGFLAVARTAADGMSDAAAVDEAGFGFETAWNLRLVKRYGVLKWIGALVNGKTRGSSHSDLELVNAAILQETRRRDATEFGKERKIALDASPSSSVVLLETPPQVRQTPNVAIRWPFFSFPVNKANR